MVVCKKMCNFEAATLGKVPTITKKNDHRTMATATIDQLQDEIIEEFNGLDEWMDRYAYIIELADTLPPLEECYKTPDNLIAGCQSRVWLHAEVDEQGLLQLQADSDALIVKGIVAMLVRVLGGHTPHEVRPHAQQRPAGHAQAHRSLCRGIRHAKQCLTHTTAS